MIQAWPSNKRLHHENNKAVDVDNIGNDEAGVDKDGSQKQSIMVNEENSIEGSDAHEKEAMEIISKRGT